MSADASYRSGGPADIAAVMEVMNGAFDPAFGEAWTAAQCSGVLSLPGVALLIAEEGGAPAGFALIRVVVDEAELLLLAVRPAFTGRGIGAALLQRAAATALAMGAATLLLEVRDGNGAINLYRRFGFIEVGRRRGYYRGRGGQLFDALSLSISLQTVRMLNNP